MSGFPVLLERGPALEGFSTNQALQAALLTGTFDCPFTLLFPSSFALWIGFLNFDVVFFARLGRTRRIAIGGITDGIQFAVVR